MKKILIYTFLGSCLVLGMSSCNSDNPNDATSKHDYSEDIYAPYLRTNAAATASMALQFPLASIDEPQEINLKDYARLFHDNLGMTVDEAMNEYDNGNVVLYNIALSKGRWDLTAPTCGTAGWYYTNASAITADPSAASVKVEFDRDKKKFVITMVNEPAAGTVLNLNLGFAIKNGGKDFDRYVRFNPSMVVTDPGKVITSLNYKGSEPYSSDEIDLSYDDFKEDIEYAMQMSIDEFCELVDDPDVIALLMEDSEGNWMWDYFEMSHNNSTGGAQGYWLDANYRPCYWDGSGWDANTFFIESYGSERGMLIGLSATGAPAGSYLLRWVYVLLEDNSRNVEFIVTINVE